MLRRDHARARRQTVGLRRTSIVGLLALLASLFGVARMALASPSLADPNAGFIQAFMDELQSVTCGERRPNAWPGPSNLTHLGCGSFGAEIL